MTHGRSRGPCSSFGQQECGGRPGNGSPACASVRECSPRALRTKRASARSTSLCSVESCLVCEQVQSRWAVPSGIIYESSRWLVDHCIGPLGVGTLIVKPKRHVVHVWDLDSEEAAELGPLLQRTASVVAELTKPAQVYVCLWSHARGEPGHIHFVVQPVTKEQRQRHGGGVRIQVAMFDANVLPPADQVEAFATKARASFS